MLKSVIGKIKLQKPNKPVEFSVLQMINPVVGHVKIRKPARTPKAGWEFPGFVVVELDIAKVLARRYEVSW